jgi:uncharacterized protein YcbK (DUF882 family)
MDELGSLGILPQVGDSIRSYDTQAQSYFSGKQGVAPPQNSFHVKAQAFDIAQTDMNKSNIDQIKQVFEKNGFKQHPKEWWHFSFGEFTK